MDFRRGWNEGYRTRAIMRNTLKVGYYPIFIKLILTCAQWLFAGTPKNKGSEGQENCPLWQDPDTVQKSMAIPQKQAGKAKLDRRQHDRGRL